MNIDFLEGKAATGGRGRIKFHRPAVFAAIMLIAGIIAGTAGSVSVYAEESTEADGEEDTETVRTHYMYKYKVQVVYEDGRVILKFSMSDLGNTSKGHPESGAKVYLFDTYLTGSADVSKDDVDVRQTGLLLVAEADFGMGDEPYVETDITDIYENTNAFDQVTTAQIKCKKTVTDTQVTFKGSSYMVHFNYSVIPNDVDTEEENLYRYLEGNDPGEVYKADRDKFSESFMTMDVVSAEYMINHDGTWLECDYEKEGIDVSATFNFSDYNAGDIISYRVKYEDGGYSSVIEHVITDLNVDVDPNGGNLNGNTDIYQRYSDGSNENDVQIAMIYETLEGFASESCEREGFTFEGFEFVEGEGEIITVVRYAYRVYITLNYSGRTITQKVKMSDTDSYKYADSQAVQDYYWNNLKPKKNSAYTMTKDDIVVVAQERTFYYVRSDMSYVSVRAVWKSDRQERQAHLIKLSSSMYKSSLFKRTDGDDEWFSSSKKLELAKKEDYMNTAGVLHTKIMPKC